MRRLMLGNEAIARGAYEAGVTVACAYPGTPSTEIMEYMAKYEDIYSEWSPNEKVSLEVAIGASLGGARALCAMKHVGLNVAADPLFTISYTGINGGLVIVVADDPGMHSSQNEQDSRYYARFSKVPMLEPSDSNECTAYVKKAFEISESFDTPVLVRLTTRIAHSQSIVGLHEKSNYTLKNYDKNLSKYVMIPSNARVRRVEVEKKMDRLYTYADTVDINTLQWGSKDIGIITSGVSYQYAKEAFPDASFLKLGMVHPLPEKTIQEFAAQVQTLYVIEELEPFIEDQIKKMGIPVQGKNLLPIIGELNVQILKEKISEEPPTPTLTLSESIPVRPPVLCPGCPHRAVYFILKKLALHVSGDIGCYSLGALPPMEAMDTCICMGASVSAVLGMEKAQGPDFAKKSVAVVGESTFIHSGITGLIDIVYNKGNSTILILDNSTTGMTGHQDNPTTGFTIKGEPTKQIDLIALCKAVGVDRVQVVDPFDLPELERIICEETSASEPSVIIAQRPCVLLKGIALNPPLYVNEEKCKNCGACLKLGCPAMESLGTHVKINEAVCRGCGLCIPTCKFNALEKVGEANETV